MFWNYFDVVTRAPKLKGYPFEIMIPVVALCLINLFAMGDASWWFAYISLFAFVSAIFLYYYCANKPSMEAAFPINHRKKLLYRFLTSLILFIMYVLVIASAAMIIVFISWIYNTSEVQVFPSKVKYLFDALGVYGGLFGLAHIITMYSTGMIAGFMKRRMNRNIFLVCICIGEFLFYAISGACYNNINDVNSGPRLPFSAYYYGSMKLPWLFILFCFIFAAAMLGWAIYLGIKHYNPKKF